MSKDSWKIVPSIDGKAKNVNFKGHENFKVDPFKPYTDLLEAIANEFEPNITPDAWEVNNHDSLCLDRISSNIQALNNADIWHSVNDDYKNQIVEAFMSMPVEKQNKIIDNLDKLDFDYIESYHIESEIYEEASDLLPQLIDDQGRICGFEVVDTNSVDNTPQKFDDNYEPNDDHNDGTLDGL